MRQFGIKEYRRRLKALQQELIEVRSFNQQLLASITSILIGIQPNGKIQHWNAIAEKTFGISQERVLEKPLLKCGIPWETKRVWNGILECRRRLRPVRIDDVGFKRINGETGYLGFTVIPMRDSKRKVTGVLIFGADITKRKEDELQLKLRTEDLAEANTQLAKEKIQYQTLLESIGDGMIALARDGRIMMMNYQTEKMLGLRRGEVIGQRFDEAIPIEDEKGKKIPYAQRPVTRTLQQGKQVSAMAYYVRRDQRVFPVAITVSPLIVDGKVAGAIEIFRDITKQIQIDRLKSEFISTVSHELRTPLTGIQEGVSQVIEGLFGPINGEQKEFLTIALDEIKRLGSILNDILDISKIEAGAIELKKKWTDFAPLIRKLATGYQGMLRSKQLSLKTVFPEGPVRVYADEERITQVLTNLISNAYKFTDSGGEITIEVQPRQTEVQVTVRDTGQGIHPEDLTRIFDRFVQVERTDGPGRKGTGLGLPICKSLVGLHKGRMWAESEIGKGSRFIFTLPLTGS